MARDNGQRNLLWTETSDRDGILSCDRCGGAVLTSGRCPRCTPRLARDSIERSIIRTGKAPYCPNIQDSDGDAADLFTIEEIEI